jgi:hypothetical protein
LQLKVPEEHKLTLSTAAKSLDSFLPQHKLNKSRLALTRLDGKVRIPDSLAYAKKSATKMEQAYLSKQRGDEYWGSINYIVDQEYTRKDDNRYFDNFERSTFVKFNVKFEIEEESKFDDNGVSSLLASAIVCPSVCYSADARIAIARRGFRTSHDSSKIHSLDFSTRTGFLESQEEAWKKIIRDITAYLYKTGMNLSPDVAEATGLSKKDYSTLLQLVGGSSLSTGGIFSISQS